MAQEMSQYVASCIETVISEQNMDEMRAVNFSRDGGVGHIEFMASESDLDSIRKFEENHLFNVEIRQLEGFCGAEESQYLMGIFKTE